MTWPKPEGRNVYDNMSVVETIRHHNKDTHNKFNGQIITMTICRGSLCSESLGHHSKDTHNKFNGQIITLTI